MSIKSGLALPGIIASVALINLPFNHEARAGAKIAEPAQDSPAIRAKEPAQGSTVIREVGQIITVSGLGTIVQTEKPQAPGAWGPSVVTKGFEDRYYLKPDNSGQFQELKAECIDGGTRNGATVIQFKYNGADLTMETGPWKARMTEDGKTVQYNDGGVVTVVNSKGMTTQHQYTYDDVLDSSKPAFQKQVGSLSKPGVLPVSTVPDLEGDENTDPGIQRADIYKYCRKLEL